MVFNAQNAGNHISELLDFTFFWGACPQTPLGESINLYLIYTKSYHFYMVFLGFLGIAFKKRGKGPCSPFSGYSRLLHL